MKKIILMLVIVIAAATNITAKGSNMAFGVDYNYSSKGGGSGVGFQLEYELLKNLRIAPEFIYTFSTDDCGHFSNVNINLQYVVKTGSGFDLYPMVGLAYVNGEGDLNNCGMNVGCGAEFSLSSELSIYTEQTLQLVNDATRFIPAFGLKYKF